MLAKRSVGLNRVGLSSAGLGSAGISSVGLAAESDCAQQQHSPSQATAKSVIGATPPPSAAWLLKLKGAFDGMDTDGDGTLNNDVMAY